MGKEFLMCGGDIEIEQNKVHQKKDSICNNIYFGEKKL